MGTSRALHLGKTSHYFDNPSLKPIFPMMDRSRCLFHPPSSQRGINSESTVHKIPLNSFRDRLKILYLTQKVLVFSVSAFPALKRSYNQFVTETILAATYPFMFPGEYIFLNSIVSFWSVLLVINIHFCIFPISSHSMLNNFRFRIALCPKLFGIQCQIVFCRLLQRWRTVHSALVTMPVYSWGYALPDISRRQSARAYFT